MNSSPETDPSVAPDWPTDDNGHHLVEEAEAMLRRSVQIQYIGGLHMRPAVLLVQACQKFKAQVSLWLGERRADGRNIWDILALGAGQGAELILEIDGPDAADAFDVLEAILAAPDMTIGLPRDVPPKG